MTAAAASLVEPNSGWMATPVVVTAPARHEPQPIVVHQTNHYTVRVDDLEDLNEAVEFVKGLSTELELIFTS